MLEISLFYTCVPKNHNHMRFGSWDTDWEGQNFLSFCAIFCLFIHQTTQKVKILKKMEKASGDVIVQQKSQSYDVCFLRYGVRQR